MNYELTAHIVMRRQDLPIDYSVNDLSLFSCSFSQIDAGRFDALMPHEIGKKGNVVALFQKAFCKAMPEGMRIDNSRINLIANGQLFELAGNATGCDSRTLPVDENEAAFLLLFSKPGKGFFF